MTEFTMEPVDIDGTTDTDSDSQSKFFLLVYFNC